MAVSTLASSLAGHHPCCCCHKSSCCIGRRHILLAKHWTERRTYVTLTSQQPHRPRKKRPAPSANQPISHQHPPTPTLQLRCPYQTELQQTLPHATRALTHLAAGHEVADLVGATPWDEHTLLKILLKVPRTHTCSSRQQAGRLKRMSNCGWTAPTTVSSHNSGRENPGTQLLATDATHLHSTTHPSTHMLPAELPTSALPPHPNPHHAPVSLNSCSLWGSVNINFWLMTGA